MRRRELLTAAASALALAACGGAPPPPARPAEPSYAPLHLEPATDLVSPAALLWMIDAAPRAIFAEADWMPALATVLPEANLTQVANENGGLDLRQLERLVFARYEETDLTIARGLVDPVRLEKAFAGRAAPLEGRAQDRANGAGGAELQPVTRVWGSAGDAREQLAIFGRAGAARERGRFGPLRVAIAFAQGKLKKARPALRADPLAKAAELLPADAPLRGFAPGPFEGEWAGACGGLLGASTAFAASARPGRATKPGQARVDVRVVLLGAWGKDAEAAGRQLQGAWDALAGSALGRLCGADGPLEPARVTPGADAIVLDVALDATAVARGIRAATAAEIDEVMKY